MESVRIVPLEHFREQFPEGATVSPISQEKLQMCPNCMGVKIKGCSVSDCHNGFIVTPRMARQWTRTQPGSPERLAFYCSRHANRRSIFDSRDRVDETTVSMDGGSTTLRFSKQDAKSKGIGKRTPPGPTDHGAAALTPVGAVFSDSVSGE